MTENKILSHNTRRDSAEGSTHSALRIDSLQCLNLRGRDVTCSRCADICSAKALDLTADEVRLDLGRCTACGACLPVCPSDCFSLTGFDPRQFLQTVAGNTEIHIHCSRSSDSYVELEVELEAELDAELDAELIAEHIVPCLQVLDARILAAVAADGAKTVVLHGRDQCSNCVQGDAHAAIEKMHADLINWFNDVPVQLKREDQEQTTAQEQLNEEQQLLSRRNFLRFAGAHVAQGASRWLVDSAPEVEETSSRWPLSSRSEYPYRPSVYQQLLAERAGTLSWQDHRLPWRSRLFSDSCNACLTCVKHCPTGALLSEQSKATISIWFEVSLCTDCGLCEHLCPESAISSVSAADLEELYAPARRLVQRSLRQCTDCARRFVPGPDSAERCTVCHNEHALKNDWIAMLTPQ